MCSYDYNRPKIRHNDKSHSVLEPRQMNLHEECLLKYLQNPDELSYSTDVLKLNNHILEKQFLLKNFLAKYDQINYTNSHV
jgi:hypothetical protein